MSKKLTGAEVARRIGLTTRAVNLRRSNGESLEEILLRGRLPSTPSNKLTGVEVARRAGLTQKAVSKRTRKGEELATIRRVFDPSIKHTLNGVPVSTREIARLAGISQEPVVRRLSDGESPESIVATGRKKPIRGGTVPYNGRRVTQAFIAEKSGMTEKTVAKWLAEGRTADEIIFAATNTSKPDVSIESIRRDSGYSAYYVKILLKENYSADEIVRCGKAKMKIVFDPEIRRYALVRA